MTQLNWTEGSQPITSTKCRDLRRGNCNSVHSFIDPILGVFVLDQGSDREYSWNCIKGTDELTENQTMGAMAIRLDEVFIISLDGTSTVIINKKDGRIKTIDHETYGESPQIINVEDEIYLIGGIDNDKIYHFNEQNDQYDEFMVGRIQTDESRVIINGNKALFLGYVKKENGEWNRMRTITELDLEQKSIQTLNVKTLNDIAPCMIDDNVLVCFGSFPSGFPSSDDDRNQLKWDEIYLLSLLNGGIKKTEFILPIKTEIILYLDVKIIKEDGEIIISGYVRKFEEEYKLNIPVPITALMLSFYVLPVRRIHIVNVDNSKHYYLDYNEAQKLEQRIIVKKQEMHL